LKVTQGHRKWRILIAICHFLLVICRNNISVLHRLRDIITFTVYATIYDL